MKQIGPSWIDGCYLHLAKFTLRSFSEKSKIAHAYESAFPIGNFIFRFKYPDSLREIHPLGFESVCDFSFLKMRDALFTNHFGNKAIRDLMKRCFIPEFFYSAQFAHMTDSTSDFFFNFSAQCRFNIFAFLDTTTRQFVIPLLR